MEKCWDGCIPAARGYSKIDKIRCTLAAVVMTNTGYKLVERVSKVLHPARYVIGHLQASNCTGTDHSVLIRENTPKIPKKHKINKLALGMKNTEKPIN